MSQYSTIDNISRMLSVLRMMAREEGASITEIVKATGIDRWTVRDMLDRMEDLSPDGKGLCIQEYENELDRRQTRYRVPKDTLWTITIPGMSLSDEEALLLALMFESGRSNPILKDSLDSLKKKMCMFKNIKNYEVLNVSTVKKVSTKQTQKVMLAILNAMNEGKCINFKYKPVRRDVAEYQLMPLGVFKYDSGYYLAAQKLPEGEYRSFGLERVTDIPTSFEYEGVLPEKYDYEELFKDPFGPFGHKDEFEAVLKFDSFHGFYNMEKDWPNAVKIEEQEDESVIMRAKTCSYSGIRQFIMGFGNGVEVLEPEWLRNSIRDNHIRAAQVYSSIDSEEKTE